MKRIIYSFSGIPKFVNINYYKSDTEVSESIGNYRDILPPFLIYLINS